MNRHQVQHPFELLLKGLGGVGNLLDNVPVDCDISESSGEYKLLFDLPGYAKEDISIDVQGRKLTLSAKRERESRQGEQNSRLVVYERQHGQSTRFFEFPVDIDRDGIKAEYKDGVLGITVPKASGNKSTSTIRID